jgi:hypothetical protein
MSVTKFQDDVFLEYKTNHFVWEPAWETFRPIQSVDWSGDRFVNNDNTYCIDPMDELYGFGSQQMKQVCDALRDRYAASISGATVVKSPQIGALSWFGDRYVSMSPCAPKTSASWKKMCRGSAYTRRHVPSTTRNKFTKRKLVH